MNVAYEPMTRFNVKPGTMELDETVEHGGYNAGNNDVSAERLFTAPCSSRSEYKDANGKVRASPRRSCTRRRSPVGA